MAILVDLRRQIPLETDLDSEWLVKSALGGEFVEENRIHRGNLAHYGWQSGDDRSSGTSTVHHESYYESSKSSNLPFPRRWAPQVAQRPESCNRRMARLARSTSDTPRSGPKKLIQRVS